MSSACPPQQSEEQPHPRISHPAAATARISPSRAARISSGLPPPSPSPASSIPAVCISRLHHGRPRAPRPRIAAAVKPSRPSSRPPPPLRARRSRHIRHPHPARRRSRRPHRSLPKLDAGFKFDSDFGEDVRSLSCAADSQGEWDCVQYLFSVD